MKQLLTYLLASDETIRREFEPLQSVDDNHPKLVLSLDPVWGSDMGGIQRRNVIDFLLD